MLASLEQYQVFKPIIISDTIDMMNNFTGLKMASKMLFHNKPMLKNIAPTLSEWVLWLFDEYITVPSYISALLSRSTRRFVMTRIMQGSRWLCCRYLKPAAAFAFATRNPNPLHRSIVTTDIVCAWTIDRLTATAFA